jgi:hypothetical protein
MWSIIALLLLVVSYLGYQNWRLNGGSIGKATPTPVVTPKPPVPDLPKPLVYIRDNNVWVTKGGKELQLTMDGAKTQFAAGLPAVFYMNPVFSPDGTMVAFVRSVSTDTEVRSLYTARIDDPKSVKQIAADVDWSVDRVTWRPDGKAIYYATAKERFSDTKVMNVITLGDATKQMLGTFTFGSGCGGGSSDPADHLLWAENINGWPLVFTVSPDGTYILRSSNCTGRGLSVFDIGKKSDSPLDEKGWQPVYFVGGKRLGFISGTAIKLIDAATLAPISSITPKEQPVSFMMSPDGNTAYAFSAKHIRTLTLSEDQSMNAIGMSPAEFNETSLSLTSIAIATGTELPLTSYVEHGIRPLYIGSHNNLVAAVVDNSTELYDFFIKHPAASADAATHFPKVNILSLDLREGKPEVLLRNAEQAMSAP